MHARPRKNSKLSMTPQYRISRKRSTDKQELEFVLRICVVMHNEKIVFSERSNLRAIGNFNRAPNLHALCASKVFAVEGRFMTRDGGISSTREHVRVDRRRGADVETVNHGSTDWPERKDDRRRTRFALRRPILHVAAVLRGSHPPQRKRLQRPGRNDG